MTLQRKNHLRAAVGAAEYFRCNSLAVCAFFQINIIQHNVLLLPGFIFQPDFCFDYPVNIPFFHLARKFLPGEQKKNLVSLRDYFSIDTTAVHRAAADALAAALVFERLKDAYGAVEPDAFLPKPITVNVKRQQPATISQKEQLARLLPLHPGLLSEQPDPQHLTRSEASRLIEQLLHEGRPRE